MSSTLEELADEREGVRAAIEALHLSPVTLEMGARPHPPQDLYGAYLEASDVFLGIYAGRYGWVAAGADLSSVEDEYDGPAGSPGCSTSAGGRNGSGVWPSSSNG